MSQPCVPSVEYQKHLTQQNTQKSVKLFECWENHVFIYHIPLLKPFEYYNSKLAPFGSIGKPVLLVSIYIYISIYLYLYIYI